jgi:murein DD-endopeptidase MepM/ murein hydrolase activator NlpD
MRPLLRALVALASVLAAMAGCVPEASSSPTSPSPAPSPSSTSTSPSTAPATTTGDGPAAAAAAPARGAPDEEKCVDAQRLVCARLWRAERRIDVQNASAVVERLNVVVAAVENAVVEGNTSVDVEVAGGASAPAMSFALVDPARPFTVHAWSIARSSTPPSPPPSSPSSSSSSSSPPVPDAGTPCNVFAERQVCVVSVDDAAASRLYLRNRTVAVVTARLTFDTPAGTPDVVVVVPAQQTVEATTLPPVRWLVRLAWQWGRSDAVLDDDVFELPWQRGATHALSQGPDGAFSHRGKEAWDFAMDTGTPVHAARGGIVAFAADSSKIGGGTPAFAEDGNVTLVVHDDGTVGLYGHLRFAGAWRREGERVDAGDLLALSGDTGFSTGPHLHFQVYRPTRDLRAETLAVRFRTSTGVVRPQAPASLLR